MKRTALAGAVLAMAAGMALAQTVTTQKAAAEKAPVEKRYEAMNTVCNLSADQLRQLDALDTAMMQAVTDYQAANADKIAAAQAAMDAATRSKDKTALDKATGDWNTLMAPLWNIAQQHYSDVLAVLTSGQKAQWQQYTAVLSIKTIYARAGLSDDQIKQVQAAYADLAKDTALTWEGLMTQLAAKTKDLLTPEQKAIMAKATKPGPFGTKTF